ncbi:hypothetical protein ZIOFF_060123 [Zingiber officinale]|uniref:C3H1-type domain-containing protein n=1 Tax=Zingiber officinale TaxID=94328 RepID=A0A8J5FB02_ZINOF|nr:hypothetical protein ZIOFF_060123 [Zingiber officinale]
MESCVLHRNKRVVLQKPPVAVPCVFWRAGRCNRRPCRFLHAEQPPSAPEKNTKRNLQTPLSSPATNAKRNPQTPLSSPATNAKRNLQTPLSSPATNAKRNLQTPLSSPATNAKRNLQPPFAPATKSMRNLEPPSAPVSNDKHDLAWRGENTASSVVSPHASSGANLSTVERPRPVESFADEIVADTAPANQQVTADDKNKIAADRDTVRNESNCSLLATLRGHQQRVRVNIMGAEVGALLTEQHWSFMGVFDSFQAYNSHTKTQYIIEELGGQVHAIAASNGFVFAGIQVYIYIYIIFNHDGSILAWQFNSEELITVQPMASLDGHLLPVMSLLVHEDKLYSGSMDHTIKGVISLCGISDANAKSVLICARSDRSVCLYDLPSFTQRGQIHFSEELKVVKSDPSGLFFTGDAAGELRVWSLSS